MLKGTVFVDGFNKKVCGCGNDIFYGTHDKSVINGKRVTVIQCTTCNKYDAVECK